MLFASDFYNAANANVLEHYTQKPVGCRYRQDYYPRPGHRAASEYLQVYNKTPNVS